MGLESITVEPSRRVWHVSLLFHFRPSRVAMNEYMYCIADPFLHHTVSSLIRVYSSIALIDETHLLYDGLAIQVQPCSVRISSDQVVYSRPSLGPFETDAKVDVINDV